MRTERQSSCPPPTSTCADRGFSLVEALVAAALALAVIAMLLGAAAQAQQGAIVQPEAADLEQRLRTGLATLAADIGRAGAGTSIGCAPGPLHRYVAPIRPYRVGLRSPQPPGTFDPSAISHAVRARRRPRRGAGTAPRFCGRRRGDRSHQRVLRCPSDAGVRGGHVGRDHQRRPRGRRVPGDGRRTRRPWSRADGAVARRGPCRRCVRRRGRGTVVPAFARCRNWRVLPLAIRRVHERASGGGSRGWPDVRVPRRASPREAHRGSVEEPAGPWTTYGPKPPPIGYDNPLDTWPAGESCLFAAGDPLQVPRLPALGDAAGGLVPLAGTVFSDGPWCADGGRPGAFDADLFRIRRVVLTLRVEAPSTFLRGPLGPLFARSGSATGGSWFVPDRTVTVDIAPRNMGTDR